METHILDNSVVVDLIELPLGGTYEDTYGSWLDIFKTVHSWRSKGKKVTVVDCPGSWVILFRYMGCSITGIRFGQFVNDSIGSYAVSLSTEQVNRTLVEVLSCFRPEVVDALWKIDNEWGGIDYQDEDDSNFIITCNGGFYRREIREYLTRLSKYRESKNKVVLVPCSADKPYPSELHSLIIERLPSDYYLAIVTGALGIVPYGLWDKMPNYDLGVPNHSRVIEIVTDYFLRNRHSVVISYLDFYNTSIATVFKILPKTSVPEGVVFINEVKPCNNYVDLQSERRLNKLFIEVGSIESGGKTNA